MGWLETKVLEIHRIAGEYEVAVGQREDGQKAKTSSLRKELRFALSGLVDKVAALPDVIGCFATRDGLLMEGSGPIDGLEAAAAMAQWCILPGKDAAETLQLGKLSQLVIIGEGGKLALIHVEGITIGVLAPTQVNLGELLTSLHD